MEEEIWKLIPDFEKYEASNLGKIRNAKTKKLLKPSKTKNRYHQIVLVNDESKRKSAFVHRLIGFTFIPNTNNDATINHKNRNRTDNRVINLEWASMKQQNQPENKLPRTNRNISGARSVYRIDKKKGEILQIFESSADAGRWVEAQGLAKTIGIYTNINKVCRGKQKTAYGFRWEYTPDEVIDSEIWKPLSPSLIHGTEGYFVSNKGRLKNKTGYISLGTENIHGSPLMVNLSFKYYTLRRLIAGVFIENPDNLPFVISLDKNHENNCVENLTWVSLGDAQLHSMGRLYRHQSNLTTSCS
jgi:hypothetical protein